MIKPDSKQQRAAIVLAGGDGTRLNSLTRRIAGHDLPKQFCPVIGGETLLEQTVRRVSLGIPTERIALSLSRAHAQFYEPLLSGIPERNMVAQPGNRGTAAAILYSLLRLAHDSPEAVVGIFPSDHYVNDDWGFMRHVDRAFAAVHVRPELTVLLGIEPNGAEAAYGWIEPAERIPVEEARIFGVNRFWEKPSQRVASTLFGRRCLWNSFVMVSRLSTLLGLFMVAMPGLYGLFSAIRPTFGSLLEERAVEKLYAGLSMASFSDDVLATCPMNLAVLPVQGVEWSDLGEPSRVIETLARIGLRPQWAAA
jgi:mannose-1-phosphate guanylyltransferase